MLLASAAVAVAGPQAVHYLPILTTGVSLAFIVVLARRASKRAWPPHLVWWAIGVFFYGLGTAVESSITLLGNSPLLNTTWYWAGAILGGYPLATGSVYLLFSRRVAHALTGVSLAVVAAVSVAVFLSPVNAAELEPHRPGGAALEWQWVRALTPVINLYAAVFLIGGALWSTARFLQSGNNPKRALGTALIAFGALLPGIGGGMAKAGIVEALYIGELVGLVLIWLGFEVCVRAPTPRDPGAASAGTADGARSGAR